MKISNAGITLSNGVEIKVWCNDDTGEACSQFIFPPIYGKGNWNVTLKKSDGIHVAVNNAIAEYGNYCHFANMPHLLVHKDEKPAPRTFGGMPLDDSDLDKAAPYNASPGIGKFKMINKMVSDHLAQQEREIAKAQKEVESTTVLDEVASKAVKRQQAKIKAKKASKRR